MAQPAAASPRKVRPETQEYQSPTEWMVQYETDHDPALPQTQGRLYDDDKRPYRTQRTNGTMEVHGMSRRERESYIDRTCPRGEDVDLLPEKALTRRISSKRCTASRCIAEQSVRVQVIAHWHAVRWNRPSHPIETSSANVQWAPPLSDVASIYPCL
ncbi:hypothetical protein NEOLEDRAFT_1146661 [Neolentinus lepideus HHB14362 ss-1]|uniref:Uncharacterized protein n=1 Tax=Neolentinus lepideus HHB14362 ss-1 TaxID=1314782 RepID=A0A165TSJ0_9AGAM|nr:hypothetical protein NEOLEDRAFT_1146661 [Neolentinus lepideus HHB14362 ss-1]